MAAQADCCVYGDVSRVKVYVLEHGAEGDFTDLIWSVVGVFESVAGAATAASANEGRALDWEPANGMDSSIAAVDMPYLITIHETQA